jgi:[FeFe] hydrogenase H-cluster maturation GTPase HydF
MSLNATPSSERVHIGIFGKRNAGKSSLINAITGQNLAIVSEAKGTTTDPVYKAMELLPLGPVMIIDTPGIDDEGVLGSLRIQKAYQVLNKTDIALVIIDAAVGPSAEDLRLIKRINAKKIPLLIVINKCETINEDKKTAYQALLPNGKLLFVSAEQKLNIFELKEAIAQTVPADENKAQIVADLLSPSDFVVLVVPIDSAAPKGRLILPQQQTIRDILKADAAAIVVKENELTNTLQNLGKRPKLVITDSQVFKKVAAETPADILLTSFSILFARYKGNLQTSVQGVTALESLEDGDKILVGEGCTHHR